MTATSRAIMRWAILGSIAAMAAVVMLFGCAPLAQSDTPAQEVPAVPTESDADWPQLGRDAQHTNFSPQQVDPPFCYAWKWYGAPLASRAQPVIAAGRLFVGTLDGWVLARDAGTGAPLWQAQTSGPIRHSLAATANTVVTGNFAGDTIAYAASNGARRWAINTGSSATAPLLDEARNRVYVAATDGTLTALALDSGARLWSVDLGAPVLATPALSIDGATLYAGVEAVDAVAIAADNGAELWRTTLHGQSLADRYPVVAGDKVYFRSQPLDFFHHALHAGDDVLDRAGGINTNDWAADWAAVKPQIATFLTQNPEQQTFFVLDANTGAPTGALPPILYTYGNNDIPAAPVIDGDAAYVAYRARNGIQNRSPNAVHVTTKYDAELGRMDLQNYDITGLRTKDYPTSKFNYEFRLTSDEPAVMTMGGNLLLVDNWERLGAVRLTSATQGTLEYIGHVSSDWPECFAQCGPGGANPFFPMSGNAGDPAYPFPSPRVMEGRVRGGAAIANGMIYWRVAEGGLAAIEHRAANTCPPPRVYLENSGQTAAAAMVPQVSAARPLTDYVTLDLTVPVSRPPSDLANRLRDEVSALVAAQGHLLPYYVQRGFSKPQLWPYNTTNPPGPPIVTYDNQGNVYWHDPGELLYSMASAYPYLDADLQGKVKQYMAQEMERYPPLRALPYGGMPWLKQGTARELYDVPIRTELNNWPPVDVNLSALYALWLWSKNTDDWSYAQAHWGEAKALFAARSNNIRYYADIGGLIGYARLAAAIDGAGSTTYRQAEAAAVQALEAGRDFDAFRERADNEYLDPRDLNTGWYLPVFFGMTPEIGLYLSEQVPGAASLILEREQGDGLRWWYMTRAGVHAEYGETSFVAPNAAWSHFLAHAYVLQERQQTLRQYLDRPWAVGDLFSLQKIAATIGAPAIVDTDFIYLPLTRP